MPDIRKFAFVMASESNNGAATNGTNGAGKGPTDFVVKAGLAQMFKGGVIMDVVNAEQVPFVPCV